MDHGVLLEKPAFLRRAGIHASGEKGYKNREHLSPDIQKAMLRREHPSPVNREGIIEPGISLPGRPVCGVEAGTYRPGHPEGVIEAGISLCGRPGSDY